MKVHPRCPISERDQIGRMHEAGKFKAAEDEARKKGGELVIRNEREAEWLASAGPAELATELERSLDALVPGEHVYIRPEHRPRTNGG